MNGIETYNNCCGTYSALRTMLCPAIETTVMLILAACGTIHYTFASLKPLVVIISFMSLFLQK